MSPMKQIVIAALVGCSFVFHAVAQEKPAAGKAAPDAADKDPGAKKDDPKDKTAAKPAAKVGKTPTKPQDKRVGSPNGKDSSTPADGAGPAGDPASNSAAGKTATGATTDTEPNWLFEEIVVRPYGTATFSRDKISLSPPDGYSFVEVGFRVTALRPDPKAIESYAKVWKNVNRKELSQRSRLGARAFEMRHLALVDSAGVRHVALWNLDEAVRYNVYTAEIQQNSTRQTHQGFWRPNNVAGTPTVWLDSEQSFLTRTIRPPNRPAIVEQVTYFSGILEVQTAVDVNFLFGIPNTVDRETLSLAYESRPFAVKRVTAP